MIGQSGEVSTALIRLLEEQGWNVSQNVDTQVDLAVVFVGADESPTPPHNAQNSVSSLTEAMLAAAELVEPLEVDKPAAGRRALLTVTAVDGAHGYSGSADPDTAALAGISGLVKTFAIEAPEVYCRSVDIDPSADPRQAAAWILAEACDVDTSIHEVGINAVGRRMTVVAGPEADESLIPDLNEVDPPARGDLLVVTGGGRGVTASCALGLARAYGCDLLLLGRSSLSDEPEWATGVSNDQLRRAAATALAATEKATPKAVELMVHPIQAAREIRETLHQARLAGVQADYLAVDVDDRDAIAAAVSPWRERITGVVHGAGIIKDSLIREAKGADVTRVLHTKIAGLSGLLDALDGVPLRHIVLFSSTAGFFGNQGQAAYGMANEALNKVAVSLRSRHPDTAVTAIDWSAWNGGMVTPALAAMFADRGVPLIPLEVGVAQLVEQLGRERSADVVVGVGPELPLSGNTSVVRAPRSISLRRRLDTVVTEPLVLDHRIGEESVLPATAVMGLFLRSAGFSGEAPATGLRDFEVVKGIAFDDMRPESVIVEFCEPEDGGRRETVLRDDSGRVRFRAIVDESPLITDSQMTRFTDDGAGTPVNYEDGTLFHGPKLRGLKQTLHDSPGHLVFEAHSTGASPADGAWGTADFDPADADLLLQAALVAAQRETGQSCLPSSVAEVRVYRRPPRNSHWYIDVRVRDSVAPIVTTDVTALTSDGAVLLVMNEVRTVSSPRLATLFAGHHVS